MERIKNWIKYSNVAYKLIIFLVILIFGTLITSGNWIVGVVGAIMIVMSMEINEAYEKGKKDGYEECRRIYEK